MKKRKHRDPYEGDFEWVSDESEQPEPFSRRAVGIAMIIRLVIIGAVLWWVFGQFSSDMHKLFKMGTTFILW